MNVNELLQLMIKKGISDIHFKAASPPIIRVNGKLIATNFENFTAKHIHELAYSIMSPEQQALFERDNEVDISYAIDGVSRFRVNVYRQKNTIAVTLRVVPLKIKSFEDLNMPVEVLRKLSEETRGLILVAGITGAGKTTTLNSIIDYINNQFAYNIVTVEDPIEFFHQDKKSTISQREIGSDTKSFKSALKHVLRQDPDVVVIGEMREFEAIASGITAAETGHLVMSTIHTMDSVQTIDRIVDSYPPHQQLQIRLQLANILKGVIGQRLLISSDGEMRYPATETLICTSLIRKLIVEGKSQEIYKSIEQGDYYGMHTFDQDLYRLYKQGKVNLEEALENATNPDDLMLKIRGIGSEAGVNSGSQ
ncbi:MAG: type IV pilus twitching motility protein PilT [bacterium]